ncbi:MAG: hypothetical protein OXQ29_12870, partial [Rhodospirillaceae bacterium]|nr:hypothetical protein [Rhodospirillaceae bacterium]
MNESSDNRPVRERGTGSGAAAGAVGSAPSARVLFVCMGNICRSPTAEGVFRETLRTRAPELHVHVDSAGTHAYH